MIEAYLLPTVLWVLALLCQSKEITRVLLVWFVVYVLDAIFGSSIASTYPEYYLYSIGSMSVIVASLFLLKTHWFKGFIILSLAIMDLSISAYEITFKVSDAIYPYLYLVSWIIIELQLLVLIYNIKFKLPEST